MTNKTIGQSSSHTDGSESLAGVLVSGTTTVKILDGEIVAEGSQSQRLLIFISVTGKDAFIKLYPAATDNLQKGIPIAAGGHLILTVEAMYFGEISAISTSPSGSTIYVTLL